MKQLAPRPYNQDVAWLTPGPPAALGRGASPCPPPRPTLRDLNPQAVPTAGGVLRKPSSPPQTPLVKARRLLGL